jgi:hypothetical protein
MELEKIGGQIGVDDSGGGADNAGGDDTPADAGTATTASAGTIKVPVGFFAVETPVVEADEPAPTSDLNAPPVMSADDSELRPWTCPVMWVEGQETGDGRMINAEAVEWFNPPLPLMLLKTSPHGGEWDPNDPAVWCGLINSITRVAGEGGTQLGTASGYYLNTADGNDAHDIVESMGRAGISIDLQVVESEISGELDDDGWPTQTTMTVVKGMLMGATICPFPAFNQAYIVNGDGTDGGPAAIPQQSDNTPPIVASGGQLIHWMTSEECVPCADGVDVLIASAAPNRPPRSWFEDPNFAAIDDERLVEIYSVDHKGNMIERGDMACPITVTDDGQVFGHVAAWGQCHRLYTNMCVTPPSSKTGYAGFRHGWVKTAEGDDVRVGSLTAGTGHAAMNLNRVESEQHYANSGYSVADVNIGEDAYGIWIAGRVSPLATDDQIEALRTGGQSGDWRNGEMIASLTVNVPGFPMAIVPSKLAPRQWSKGSQTTLIAAGAAPLFRVKYNKALAASAGQPVEFIDHAAREAIKPLLPIIRANLARKINLGI